MVKVNRRLPLYDFLGYKLFTESTTYWMVDSVNFGFDSLVFCYLTGFFEIQVLSSIVVVIPRQ